MPRKRSAIAWRTRSDIKGYGPAKAGSAAIDPTCHTRHVMAA
jgi:hypothetical protein